MPAKLEDEYPQELEKEENELSENDDFSEAPPSDIVAFNELRSCADLLRMYKANQLIIKPDFQRDVVWKNPAQTRFVDSLVKQLPIPSMCLALDYKTGERLMIDGLQRMSSIINFLNDENWRLSDLEDVDARISGKTPAFVKDKHYEIYSRVENLTIPVTVLRCDYSKKSHMHYLFTIFHRLNTGGNKLTNQEIRNCIFHGTFNELIKTLVTYKNFTQMFSVERGKTYRFAYEELVLRFLAFLDNYEKYNGRLAKYLNEYMSENRFAPENWLEERSRLFRATIDLFYEKILSGRPLPKLSKATIEAAFVGVARNIENLEQETPAKLRKRFELLRENDNFSVESLKEGLSRKERVTNRMNKAVEIFM